MIQYLKEAYHAVSVRNHFTQDIFSTMKLSFFQESLKMLIEDGYEDEINWQRNLAPVTDPVVFRDETIWVILNSGMKEQIARMIWNRIKEAWNQGKTTETAFRHKGKVAAIDQVCANYKDIFKQYQASDNKVDFLQTIPFIGGITKWHLAKNMGIDVVKPDRHLIRIANYYKTTPDDLCEKLSKETGEKKCVVDIILWRGANLGIFSDENLLFFDPQ
jgi:hypothetical protein